MHRFSQLNRQRILTSFLALALVFVQTLGLLHSVAHAGNGHASHGPTFDQTGAAGPVLSETSLFDGKHSCASFEAATLAAAVHVKAFAALLPIESSLPRPSPLPISRDALTHRHFEPRAPPSRLS